MGVYLDHAATTPMRASAVEAYAAAAREAANPASIHGPGQGARRMLEDARERIAATLGCDPIEVVLTSGGTESVNTALKGLFWARVADGARPVVVVPAGEHHATLDAVSWLERHEGARIRTVPLDGDGRIDPRAFDEALAEEGDAVACATAIAANNEVGTIQPLEELAAVAAARSVPLHVDAVSAYGQLPVDVSAIRRSTGATGTAGLVALSVSAHKIGGPVGVGALVLARGAAVEPLLHGGGQQRQVRSGTQDVAGAVAFAVAAEEAEAEREAEGARLRVMRDRALDAVEAAVPGAVLNGPRGDERLPGNLNVGFPGCQGDSLLFLLDMAGVAVSTGSACQAGVPEPSHVLLAMGRTEAEAAGALRITMGRTTTDADVDALLSALPGAHRQALKAGLSDREAFRLRG